jgi:outer membrane receptor protein involved in Fe transport
VVWGATTGKITGVVTDSQTKEPLIGVTVSVVGTNLGAITDEDGHYIVLNVPVGTYTLRMTAVGYAGLEVSNVAVSADLATYQDHELSSKATDLGKTIRVTAEAPLVIKDKTSTINVIKRDQLLALPTRGFEQVVGLQNSVVRVRNNISVRQRGDRETNQYGELNLRGGRRSEVAYYVDGFSQQDPLTGVSTANISNNAIQEVAVIAGGFPAEYGHVSSGIVNTITNSGTREYRGSVETVTDNLGGNAADQNWYSANLGGPIPGIDNGYFFGSVERRYFGDREPSAIVDRLPGSPERLPYNTLSGWSWQGKLNFDITPNFKLFLSTNGSEDQWYEYRHTYLYNGAHNAWHDDDNMGINGRITHTLSSNTFYNFSISYFMTERFRGDGIYREDLLAYYVPEGNPRFDNRAMFWSEGHIWDDYLRRKSSYVGFKFDLTTQVDPNHTLKFGADFQRHTLRYFRHYFPSQVLNPGGFNDINRYGYDKFGNEIDGDGLGNEVKNPINFALFAQDRFDWQGLIINAGLRFDYFDYKAKRIRNAGAPLDPDRLEDDRSQTLEPERDFADSEKFTRVSPRLGIAFPVSDKTQLHLNYGKFFQRPDLENLYVGDDYFEHKVNLGGYYVPFGNPNLEPEKTTQYELGLTHQLGDNTVLDATAFHKDVTDLVQVINQPAVPNSYQTFVNLDYGTVKGLEFRFTMERTRNIYLNVKYSLSYASGTGSYTNTQRNIAWQAMDPPKQTAPLDFDQRHSIIGNIDWRTEEGGGPRIGDGYPLENFGINILVTAASGLPYSPSKVYNEITLGASAPTPTAPRNSSYGPWTFVIDLKAEKTFNFTGYSLVPFVWVKNLLDRDNVYNVYEATGKANTTNWLSEEPGQAYLVASPELDAVRGLTAEEEYRLKENNPGNYGSPRQIMLGLRLTF